MRSNAQGTQQYKATHHLCTAANSNNNGSPPAPFNAGSPSMLQKTKLNQLASQHPFEGRRGGNVCSPPQGEKPPSLGANTAAV